MARAKRRMTAMDFDAVRPFLDISEDRCEAARSALVDGNTLQSVASRYGWTRQAVNDAVAAVWRTYERYKQSQQNKANAGMVLPPGWEQATFVAPSHVIDEFRAKIAELSPPATVSPEKTTK